MNQIIKKCAEYIWFHSTTKKIIPFDSERAHFLHIWFFLTNQQFTIPSEYDTLCLQIHDACTCLFFGINLKRNMAPGIGRNKPWIKDFNIEEKEVLEDPSINLPIVLPQKRKYRESPGTVLQSSRTVTRSKISQPSVSNSNTTSVTVLQSSLKLNSFSASLIPVSNSNTISDTTSTPTYNTDNAKESAVSQHSKNIVCLPIQKNLGKRK